MRLKFRIDRQEQQMREEVENLLSMRAGIAVNNSILEILCWHHSALKQYRARNGKFLLTISLGLQCRDKIVKATNTCVKDQSAKVRS